MSLANSTRLGLGLLSLGLTMTLGCGGSAAPTPTPSASVKPSVTPSATVSAAPDAALTPDPSATAFVAPTPKTVDEMEYDKLRAQAESLTLGKGYKEAIPLLQECLKKRPDDIQVYLYLMLCLGNLEEQPSKDSEAFKVAQTIMEKAPGTPLADRAHDYMISAESEPAKPWPDMDVKPIGTAGGAAPDMHTAYTMPKPLTIYLSDVDGLTPDVKKKVWYLEVKPDGLGPEEKLLMPKGTSFSVQKFLDYTFSKSSWKGGGPRGEAPLDTGSYKLNAYRITVEEGPDKGKRGWYANQMDRYKGVDDDGKQVWGVKIAPRLVLKK